MPHILCTFAPMKPERKQSLVVLICSNAFTYSTVMKHFFFLSLGLASWLIARAESCLMLELRDGTTHSYVLSQQPTITFGDGTLVMHAAEAEASFALAEVEKFHFAEQENGIPAIRDDERRFTFVNGVIRIDGVHEAVVLTNLAGQVLSADTSGQAFSFDLNTQPVGTYLLRIGQQAVKLYHQ